MKHFAGAFGLLGFLSAIVVGLMGDSQLASIMTSAALWGGVFFVLGYFLGRLALIVLNEAGVSKLPKEASEDPRPGEESQGGEIHESSDTTVSESEPFEEGAGSPGRSASAGASRKPGASQNPVVAPEEAAPENRQSGGMSPPNLEEIDRKDGIPSGVTQEQPIEADEASPASGALTPQPPEPHGR